MEREHISLEGPVAVSTMTVYIITRTAVSALQLGQESIFRGDKEPLFVLVQQAGLETKALRTNGEAVALDEVLTEYPQLKPTLSALTAPSGFQGC